MSIRELKGRIKIEEVIKKYVKLQPISPNLLRGFCPFHKETQPSFTVYLDTQSFCCFGCGLKGDVIDFLMRFQNKSCKEVVKFLRDNNRLL